MKKLNAFLSLLLAVLLVIPMGLISVTAASGVSVSAGSASVEVGNTVTVPISMTSNPGIVNLQLGVSYPEGFELVSVSDGGILGQTMHQEADKEGKFNNPYYLTWMNETSKENFTGTGTLASLTFKVSDNLTAGNYIITVTAGECYDKEFTDTIPVSTSNGSVNVTVPVVAVTGVELDKTAISLQEGNQTNLTATVLPAKATNKNVTWSTDAEAVASVSENGVVTAHKQGTATITVKTVDGGKTATCKVTVTHVHNFEKIAAKAATCTEDGNNEYYHCTLCDKYYKADKVTETTVAAETIKALGHDLKDVVTKAPTCTETGLKNVVCDRCGEVIEENVVIPALGHGELEEKITKAPTCTEAGEKQYICKVCGDTVKKEVIPALGHDWGEWTAISDPNDPNYGKMKRVCARCGEVEYSEHNVSDEWSTDAVAHWHECEGCADPNCNAKFDYAPHDFTDWEIKNPTATENGYKKHTCKVCGYVYMETLPATGDNTPVTPVDPDPKPVEPEDDWKNPFTDVDKNDEYYDAVKFVNQNGLFYGTGDGTTFSPDMPMTRGMFVTVLSRLAKADVSAYTVPSFADVPAGEWYAQAVEWAAENKIVLGYGDGNFGPNDQITVEQAAIILKNYAQFINKYVKSDATIDTMPGSADISDWAKEQMTWAVNNDIYEGTNGVLYPTTLASRALVATMLQNFVNEILG